MKRFIAFVKKETFHILRDTRTLVLLFVIPVILVLLFGFAITREINDAKIAILDHSKDPGTEAITDKLLASEYFNVTHQLQSTKKLQHIFKKGDLKLAIVFPNQFYKKIITQQSPEIQIITDATDPNTANSLLNYVTSLIRNYQQQFIPPTSAPHTIKTEVSMLYNPRLESAFYFVPGVITVIITLVSSMMTSVTIAREKERGTMEQLLVSPLRSYSIILGKSVPYMVLSLIIALLVLYLGYSIFGMPLLGNFTLLVAECFLFVLTAISLGILISTQVQTQRVALMLSLIGLFMPTILLSGFIFPIESMPPLLQGISNIIPAKWFIIIIKNIMLKGVGLGTVWGETLILGSMTTFFLTVSTFNFNNRLE